MAELVESDINSFRHGDFRLEIIRHMFGDHTIYAKQVYYHGTDEMTEAREEIDEDEYRKELAKKQESDEWQRV